MTMYFLKRLFFMIPTLIGITLITFFIMKMAPNSSSHMALLLAGEGVPAEQLAQIQNSPDVTSSAWHEKFAATVAGFFYSDEVHIETTFLYKSLHFIGQNFFEYGQWLWRIVHLDFGYSSRDYQPVSLKIRDALPVTLLINVLSLILIFGVSLPLGIWAAVKRGSLLTRALFAKLFFLYALPSFWLGSLLLVYFAGGDYLDWFPLGGLRSIGYEDLSAWQRLCDVAWHLVLPVCVTSISGFVFMTRFTHENMLDVLQRDFVRTAQAKGLSSSRILWRHAFRNALLPFVTLFGTLLPSLIGGSVIIEQMFAIHGMGFLAFQAILSADYNLVMAIAMLSAVLTLVGLFLQDVLYVWLDPRIRAVMQLKS